MKSQLLMKMLMITEGVWIRIFSVKSLGCMLNNIHFLAFCVFDVHDAFLCICVSLCSRICLCTGVLCGPCGPSTWLGVQQEPWSREQQHRGADGVLSPELVSIVHGNWIWSGRGDGCQWEAAIIRCEWDVRCQGWTHTHTHTHTSTHTDLLCIEYCAVQWTSNTRIHTHPH